jgi:transcriptional regulator with XRE-family HTH domain
VNQSTVGESGTDPAVSAAPDDIGDIIEGDWPAFLEKYMKAFGWDNLDVASETGIDRSQVSRWLRHEGRPTPDSLRLVCAAFHVDIRLGIAAAGMFTADELRLRTRESRRAVLRSCKPEELTEELLDRVRGATAPAVPPPPVAKAARRGSFTEQHKPVIAPLQFQDGSRRNGRAR